jgi:hypothetical protein
MATDYSGIETDSSGSNYSGATVTIPKIRYYGTPGGRQQGNTVNWGTSTVAKAVESFSGAYSTGRADATAIANALISGGLLKPNATLTQLVSAYTSALNMTARINAGGNKDATLFDAISLMGKGTTGTTGGGGGGGGTNRSFTTYSDAQAKERANAAYNAVLGRKPTEKEQKAFIKALRAGAKAAPAITKYSASGKTQKTQQGFDESAFIAGYMSDKIPDPSEDLDGVAGQVQDLIDNYREQYGVNPTQSFVRNSIKRIVGSSDPGGEKANLEQQLKEQAQVLYPALKEKIDAGITVRAIADPFISTYSRLMEENDLNVDLNNKFVRSALSNKNEKGEYQIMDEDSFARQIRSTDEWLNTRNAKETMLSAADGILQQFGFRR